MSFAWADLERVREASESGTILAAHNISSAWTVEDLTMHISSFVGNTRPIVPFGVVSDEMHALYLVFGVHRDDEAKFRGARMDTRIRGEMGWAREIFPELAV